MEHAFRTILIDWLHGDTELAGGLNAIVDDGPSPAPAPTLSIAASASADWSTKTTKGREVRLAFELIERHDRLLSAAATAARIEERIATLSPDQDGFRVVATQFLRSRVERRGNGLNAALLEYRFKLLEMPTE